MISAPTPRQLAFAALVACVMLLICAAAAGWWRAGFIGAALAVLAVWAAEAAVVSLSYQGYCWMKRMSAGSSEFPETPAAVRE